jgi:hypothetical protein
MATKQETFYFEEEIEVVKVSVNSRDFHLVERYEVRSKRRKAVRRCSKIRYRDSREAKDALWKTKVQREREEADGMESTRREARTYRCGKCFGWHLTSQIFATDWEGNSNNVA